MRSLEFLGTLSSGIVIALGSVFIAVIGGVDFLTGSEISFSIFYVIPVAIITWFVGRRAGSLASIASALIWLCADLAGERIYASATIPYWNALVRLGFFLIVTFALASLRAARLREEELKHYVVHDLRSPLANVIAGLQLLLDMGVESLESDQQKLVHISIAACNRMMVLVNSLLDLAQLESGRMRLNRQSAAVNMLFDITGQQVSAMAHHDKQHVEFFSQPGAETICADVEVTTRVLINLVSNAIKYSPENSMVTVSAAPHQEGMIVFRVADNGPGIPQEWVNRVFDRFAQVESRRQGNSSGSGLGLSFCCLAVEAQGGRIWLESELGKGTTVSFMLPRGAVEVDSATLREKGCPDCNAGEHKQPGAGGKNDHVFL